MVLARPSSDVVVEAARSPQGVTMAERDLRLEALFGAHYDFVWRSLRRLGVAPANVDDATQEVFVVAARRICAIEPGKERAFLFGTALKIASEARRTARRRPEAEAPSEVIDPRPGPEELADQQRARALLDWVLDQLPLEPRAVFVLCELEGLTMAEAAECLSLPPGTVASRLRKGRQRFEETVARLKASEERRGR
ncbi:MAG: sigma-70 family RNA polymerase sigma factor [Deltaproteobacteria bacterium]|jgi:RNA polymerase sigma-70 factor (ECF subfamily)|nr:sigma-70 family RNA polymerase sigma factor [Deltaproteobacteria bacterium]